MSRLSFVRHTAGALVVALPLAAQQPAVAAAPVLNVGDVAPDFSITASTRDGVAAKPWKLSDARGTTVVIAFFPRARSGGCTVQMEAYRDRYVETFHNGKKVLLVGISTDADTTQVAWANEKGFPMTFGSDVGGKVGQMYGAYLTQQAMDNRHLFVIGADGKIAYIARPFRQMASESYAELNQAIDKAAGGAR